MNRMLRVYISLIFLLVASFVAYPQGAKKIRQQQKITQQEIKETSQKIKQNIKMTDKQLNELNLISAQIKSQNRVIAGLTSQLDSISSGVNLINDSISFYNNRLQALRCNYAKAVKKINSHSSISDRIAFIFSAESFSQGYRRFRYLQQFSKWRNKQTETIQATQKLLEEKRNSLNSALEAKQNTINELSLNRKSLEEKKTAQNKVVKELKREGKALNTLLKAKERLAANLDKELNRIIEEEQRIAEERRKAEELRLAEEKRKEEERRLAEERRRAEELKAAEQQRQKEEAEKRKTDEKRKSSKKKSTDRSSETPVDKPEKNKTVQQSKPVAQPPVKQPREQKQSVSTSKPDVKVSGSFEDNKGNLISPVDAPYTVVKPFGRQRHPELKHVETNNSGIDVETSPGANARVVFDGKVSAVFRTEGFNNVIMVRHGEYLTIYVNISHPAVAPGQSVRVGDLIGKIYSDPDDNNRTILHFEIRKEKEKLNPQLWLK